MQVAYRYQYFPLRIVPVVDLKGDNSVRTRARLCVCVRAIMETVFYFEKYINDTPLFEFDWFCEGRHGSVWSVFHHRSSSAQLNNSKCVSKVNSPRRMWWRRESVKALCDL